jgi:hypothetical protein
MHLSRNNIYVAKFPPVLASHGFYASRDSAVFPLYIAVNAVFTGIYTVFLRYLPDAL